MKRVELKIGMTSREQWVYFSLLNRERVVTTIKQVALDQKISEGNARRVLFSLARKGVLYRIFKGCYVVIPPDMLYDKSSFINDPYIIIDQLMEVVNQKYYVAYQSAIHLHGIAHQLPFALSVVVLKQRKPLKLGESRIEFRKVSKRDFFGIRRMKYSNVFLNVSDIEKTILDCVIRYDLCGGIDEVCRAISDAGEKIKPRRLLNYIEKMNCRSVSQRLGFILDKLDQSGYKIDKKLIAGVEKHIGKKTYLLDPRSRKKGKVSKRWKIIENIDCMSWEHA